VAENGIDEAARALREFADELEALPELYAGDGDLSRPRGALGRAEKAQARRQAHRRPSLSRLRLHPPAGPTGGHWRPNL